MEPSFSTTSESGTTEDYLEDYLEDFDVYYSVYANNATNSTLLGDGQYPPYNRNLHFVFLSILSAYIPIIVISSILVVAAVIFVKQLHNTHNIILLSISMTDLVLALVVIPIQVIRGIPAIHKHLLYYPSLVLILTTTSDTVNTISISYLTLLGLDTFIKIKYPMFYRRHHANKKAIVCVTTIAVVHICIAFVFLGIRISYTSEQHYKIGDAMKLSHIRFYQISFGTMLVLCFILGVCVRWISWHRLEGKAERVTMVLLMLFILFYSPTLRLLYAFNEEDNGSPTLEKWRYYASISRYISSVTNGFFIYLSRPVYKKAFRYFIKTNPLYWKSVQQFFIPKYSIFPRHGKHLMPLKVLSKASDESEQRASSSRVSSRIPDNTISAETSQTKRKKSIDHSTETTPGTGKTSRERLMCCTSGNDDNSKVNDNVQRTPMNTPYGSRK